MKRFCIVIYDRDSGNITRSKPMTLGECLASVQHDGLREVAYRVYENAQYFFKIREVEA